jgi:hypothetical protein
MLVKILKWIVGFFPTLDEIAQVMAPDCMGDAFGRRYGNKMQKETPIKVKACSRH